MHELMINHRRYLGKLSNSKDKINQRTLHELHELSVVIFRGEKVAEFLQGQCSVDIAKISLSSSHLSAYCNIKGRVISLFRLFKLGEAFACLLPTDTVPLTLQKLAMVAKLSRVEIVISDLFVYGYYTAELNETQSVALPFTDNETLTMNDSSTIIKESAHLYLIISAHPVSIIQSQLNHPEVATNLQWKQLELRQSLFTLYPQTQEKFLPHRLALLDDGTVSVNKGCYVGQEIIARMHYKSVNKHQRVLFRCQQMKLSAGDNLVINEKIIGEIIDCCPEDNNNTLYLASVLKSALATLDGIIC